VSGIRQKVRTLAWYLRRPTLYPQLARELKDELKPSASDAEPDCRSWCEERAIDPGEAIEQLTGSAAPYAVEERFSEIFEEAWERVERARAAEPNDMPPAGRAELDLIYWLAEHRKAKRIIETGVAYGWSSLVFLLSMHERPGARLVSTDIPLQRTTGAYIGCAVPDGLRSDWMLVHGLDRKVLPRALDELGGIDLCHYDSDKTYEGREWAYRALWNALKPGGVFVSDDVDDNAAFRDFADEVGLEPVIVAAASERHRKYVGVISKITPAQGTATQ
jgi:predicted O-methyltransferase YrrM